MRRHTGAILGLVPLACAALLLPACRRGSPETEQPAAEPTPVEAPLPNILLVTFDTTRADRIGCYGHARALTPTIDRLAREGVRFERCYAPAVLTLPSHASILTGLHPFRHGLRTNSAGSLDERFTTLAEMLERRGYQTGAVVGAFVIASRRRLDQGFDVYDERFDESTVKLEFHMLYRDAEAVSDAALDWLETTGDEPWLLWAHYFDPHAPHEAPRGPDIADPRVAYDYEIAFADEQLGRVVEAVESRSQQADRPLAIVITADHGEALGEHGESTHGVFVYEEVVRVPMVIKAEGFGRAGTTVETPVSLVDIYPTVLGWAELEPPYETDGVGLPTSDDASFSGGHDRRVIYFESYGPRLWYGWSDLSGVVVGSWKYIEAPTRSSTT